MFLAGTWMLYERLRLGHQADFEAAVAALPAFDEEAAGKEAAAANKFLWPLHSPKATFDSVAKRIDRLLAEPPEPGAKPLDRKALENKYYVEAGFAKDSAGAWRPYESIVKELVDAKRKDFDAKRVKEIEELRKANSRNGFFPLSDPKDEAK
jgi:hypothetical protein